MARGVKNIKLNTFRKFLEYEGLKMIRTKGGHEIWSRADLYRPVIIQSHIDPIPEFVVLSNLRTIGCSKQVLIDYLEKK
jgi:predicted RNA binding protein YcfA (HicA-like mRNA interferase family)